MLIILHILVLLLILHLVDAIWENCNGIFDDGLNDDGLNDDGLNDDGLTRAPVEHDGKLHKSIDHEH